MLRTALIGFPASGKTTLFRLMTSAKEGGRPPKGDANFGVAKVPDTRLDRLTAMFEPRKHVPAQVEFADVAAAGKTTAQSLLDVASFRNADALLHVVRAFRDPSVPHAAGSIEPRRDAQLMEDELLLADLGVTERRVERIDRDLKKGLGDELRREREVLLRCKEWLERGQALRALDLLGEDMKRLRGFQFLSSKPLLVVINLDESDVRQADRAVELANLKDFVAGAATRAVPVCAKIELEISGLEPADAESFLNDLGLRESGLARVIRASYDLLGYVSFFTVGEDECRAWSIPRGTPAQLAAAEIHSDIARGFIRAEVVPYDLLIARGSLNACRDHGEMRLEGKDYVVQDGDVINFRHAT